MSLCFGRFVLELQPAYAFIRLPLFGQLLLDLTRDTLSGRGVVMDRWSVVRREA